MEPASGLLLTRHSTSSSAVQTGRHAPAAPSTEGQGARGVARQAALGTGAAAELLQPQLLWRFLTCSYSSKSCRPRWLLTQGPCRFLRDSEGEALRPRGTAATAAAEAATAEAYDCDSGGSSGCASARSDAEVPSSLWLPEFDAHKDGGGAAERRDSGLPRRWGVQHAALQPQGVQLACTFPDSAACGRAAVRPPCGVPSSLPEPDAHKDGAGAVRRLDSRLPRTWGAQHAALLPARVVN